MATALVSLLGLSIPSQSAQAQDDCGFGMEMNKLWSLDGNTVLDETETCRQMIWTYWVDSDGFTTIRSLKMYSDMDDWTSDFGSIEIDCEKKKLSVWVDYEYANTYAFSGTGEVKFDSGKSAKFNYWAKTPFQYIQLKDPKSFLSNLVKAKTSVSFKVGTLTGTEVRKFPIGNLLKHRATFAKYGCKF